MIALLMSLAMAAEPTSEFSERVPVRCPEQGLCRIEVPPPFVATNARSWLLVDARGEAVPFAVLEDDATEPDTRPVRLRATSDPKVVEVPIPSGYQATALSFRANTGSFLTNAQLQARRPGGEWRSGPVTVLAAGLVDEPAVRMLNPDPDATELRLSFSVPWTSLPSLDDLTLTLWDRARLTPTRVSLPLEEQGISEDGRSRYTFRLPGLALLRAVELSPEDPVYERPVAVELWEPGGEGLTLVERARDTLRRTGPSDEALQVLSLGGAMGDRVVLSVQDAWDQPLTIRSVDALLSRRVLLVEDAGALTLYGGSPDWSASYDLQLRAWELAREPATRAELGAMERNPDWQDPLDVSALQPGSVVDPSRFRFSRAVTGAGIARIALPYDVLLNTRSALSDLRLLDGERRQIPFVQDRGAVTTEITGLTQTQEQSGTITRLRVQLPGPSSPVSALVLESPDHAFGREVQVYTGAAGRRLMTSSSWLGQEQGRSRLVLPLRTVAESGLLIEVDHGDNAPITIGEVKLYGPSITLLARLPEGGATLYYGDVADVQGKVKGPLKGLREQGWEKPLDYPSYDAHALADRLMRAPASTAILGEPVSLTPGVSALDRGAATAGVVALALGMLALVGWLLKDLRASGGPAGA